MSISGEGDKLRELKHHLQGEKKGDEDAAVSSDDLKVNEPTENIEYRDEGALEGQPVSLQTSLQLNSEGSFGWDKFLHVRSIKVLLVENDYSTRHVVTALLRNCNYEVTEAENGLQAWKILEDPSIKIDLVLTEVEMPDLSGIDLLHEIMSHETHNNVPVIMMSSNDSMGTVFNYLSKGAADFLVKPIRKNELKNLWQHVWRRCRSSSGSGSETGTQTQKSVELEDVENFNHDSGSNGGYDIESMGLNVGDGSDNGSGTQSTWTKIAVDMDSPRSEPVVDRVAESPDYTCAQVIHSNTEVSGNKQPPINNVKMSGGCKEERDDASGEDNGNVYFKFIHQVEDPTKSLGWKQKHVLEKGSGNLKERTEKVHQDLNSEAPSSTVNCAANLTGSTTNTGIEPSFEHALKRIRDENDLGTAVLEDRNVFRRSDSSVFSRYNALSNANGAKMRSGCPPDSTLDKTKEASPYDLQSHSKGDHHNQPSNMCQCHCNHHNMQEQQCCQQPELLPGHHDALLEKMAATISHRAAGSSNVFGGFVEGTGGNYYSANGSASGSNQGSNEPNGSNTAVNTAGANGSGSGDGSGCGSGTRNRVEQNQTSQIEAALTMFRQKRKERGLRKKTRKQSKKRLSEQKPRFRRQFIHKTAKESLSKGTEN